MAIDHYYSKYNCECYCIRHAKKKLLSLTLRSKVRLSLLVILLVLKANTSLVASFAKFLSSKISNFLFSTSKKQFNSLQVD